MHNALYVCTCGVSSLFILCVAGNLWQTENCHWNQQHYWHSVMKRPSLFYHTMFPQVYWYELNSSLLPPPLMLNNVLVLPLNWMTHWWCCPWRKVLDESDAYPCEPSCRTSYCAAGLSSMTGPCRRHFAPSSVFDELTCVFVTKSKLQKHNLEWVHWITVSLQLFASSTGLDPIPPSLVQLRSECH